MASLLGVALTLLSRRRRRQRSLAAAVLRASRHKGAAGRLAGGAPSAAATACVLHLPSARQQTIILSASRDALRGGTFRAC
jgi:hypothetical protein